MINEALEGAVEALEVAGDALLSAADLLADLHCEAWAERGGIGAPPHNSRIVALYEMSEQVTAMLSRLADLS